MGHLLDEIKIVRASSGIVKGAGIVMHGIPVNTAGWEGVLFMSIGSSNFGVCGATDIRMRIKATNTSSTQFNSTGFKYLTTEVNILRTTAPTPSWDRRIMAIDVYKPEYQFMKCSVNGATGNMQYMAILYGPRRLGSTQARSSTCLGGTTKLTSPSTYDTT